VTARATSVTAPGKRSKFKRRTVGDIVKVPLGDGNHVYARVLPDASFAFYDSRAEEELPLQQVIRKKILFYIAVVDHAVKGGRWPVVGHIPLENGLGLPPKFIQDPINSNEFRIYENGQIRPATRQECIGLERAAVWVPEYVEERLRDYYAGRENKWVESLKIRDTYPKTSKRLLLN
jgi:hypothetical protein